MTGQPLPESLSDPESADAKQLRGFAALSQAQRQQLARLGGRTAHAAGCAHKFTLEEASIGGRKGGITVSQDRDHMSEIGRRGALQRARSRKQIST